MNDSTDKESYFIGNVYSGRLLPPIVKETGEIVLVEGSYSCHPELLDFYNLRIFLTVNPEEQLRRIKIRNGEGNLEQFREKWIPLEEQYFAAYRIAEHCELCLETSGAE